MMCRILELEMTCSYCGRPRDPFSKQKAWAFVCEYCLRGPRPLRAGNLANHIDNVKKWTDYMLLFYPGTSLIDLQKDDLNITNVIIKRSEYAKYKG